ncbi:T9SS type A sorting domain-containing protein [Hugenholtzia roseola]|uniref:T9SS type A sorting domain-containing protein n=1 Tax=Hugenholtzia roseola TaxID=1002 RepID=UPI000420CEBA|nr:T9SS type A sorting domain-containing protein [Hugenholtzia roseola]
MLFSFLRKKLTCSFLLFLPFFYFYQTSLSAQIINGYAKITAIAGTDLTISNIAGEVNETADAFAAGERLIIMQMQDDVIGTTADNTNFGDLGSIASAGLYEIATIASRTGTTITLSAPLSETYHLGANSSVQIITFPQFCTRGNTSGLAWNGNIGGVVAFFCPTTLTLTGAIVADGIGFRGGVRSNDDGSGCTTAPFRSNSASFGEKGEGIFKRTNADQRYAVAKILNGGGGGTTHNGGGGGGGNFTAGGVGGPGWNGSDAGCTPSAGGQGGLQLPVPTLNRVFMGGGGGGGQQNNSVGSNGAAGGGIIIIEANTLETSCASNATISANGNEAAGTTGGGNDSAGGGGAGGSIVLRISNYIIDAACPLVVRVNGGKGGDANFNTTHAGGGGGGQGAVLFSVGCPNSIPNLSANALNGNGGCNNMPACASSGGSGQGTNNDGILCDVLLPVEWFSFSAKYQDKSAKLFWEVAQEEGHDYFEIEKSQEGRVWQSLKKVFQYERKTLQSFVYQAKDTDLEAGTTYYRLKQVDKNGSYTYSKIVSVEVETFDFKKQLWVSPNPAKGTIRLHMEADKILSLQAVSMQGAVFPLQVEKNNIASIAHLPKGLYLIQVLTEKGILSHKILVENE